MEATEFIKNYEINLEEIRDVVRPELRAVIDELKKIDPNDFVTEETYFMTENQARIHVWRLFLQKAKNEFPSSFPPESSESPI